MASAREYVALTPSPLNQPIGFVISRWTLGPPPRIPIGAFSPLPTSSRPAVVNAADTLCPAVAPSCATPGWTVPPPLERINVAHCVWRVGSLTCSPRMSASHQSTSGRVSAETAACAVPEGCWAVVPAGAGAVCA